MIFQKGLGLFGKSNGIKAPKTMKMKYEEVLETIDDYTLSDEKTINVRSSVNDHLINLHKTEIYKKNKNK